MLKLRKTGDRPIGQCLHDEEGENLTLSRLTVFLFSAKRYEIYQIEEHFLPYLKVKYPHYRPTWPTGVQEVKAPRFLDTWHMKVVRSSPLRTGRLYPQEYPGTHF